MNSRMTYDILNDREIKKLATVFPYDVISVQYFMNGDYVIEFPNPNIIGGIGWLCVKGDDGGPPPIPIHCMVHNSDYYKILGEYKSLIRNESIDKILK